MQFNPNSNEYLSKFEPKTWDEIKEQPSHDNIWVKDPEKLLKLEPMTGIWSQLQEPSRQITLMTGRGGMELIQKAMKEMFEKEREKFGN